MLERASEEIFGRTIDERSARKTLAAQLQREITETVMKKSPKQICREVDELLRSTGHRHHVAKTRIPNPSKTLKAIIDLAYPNNEGKKRPSFSRTRIKKASGDVQRWDEFGDLFSGPELITSYDDAIVNLSSPFAVTKISQTRRSGDATGTNRGRKISTQIPWGHAYVTKNHGDITILLPPPVDASAMSIAVDAIMQDNYKLTPRALSLIEEAIGAPPGDSLLRNAYAALAQTQAGVFI